MTTITIEVPTSDPEEAAHVAHLLIQSKRIKNVIAGKPVQRGETMCVVLTFNEAIVTSEEEL